jgi:hypothetical protein
MCVGWLSNLVSELCRLIKLINEFEDLSDADLSRVIFVENLKDRLIFLLIDVEIVKAIATTNSTITTARFHTYYFALI